MPINYNDVRFAEVEADKKQALSEVEQTYAGIIGQTDQYYNAQIDASKQWADKQTQLQQANTDFTIEQIEQQKEQAQKDYTKEQSGAYVDWQKQSGAYGANAEQMAAAGMSGTGYSESSQVSMYNQHQNRVAVARESYNQAVVNYNNAIKDARLQNNAVLAEIAYQALQQQLELSLQGFQYKNQLILEAQNKKTEIENTYYGRYMDVLGQINTENAMAEEIRQYNQNYQFQLQQFAEQKRQYEKDYTESVRQFNEEIKRLKEKDAKEHKEELQRLELEKQQLIEEKRQYDKSMELAEKELNEQKRQFDEAQKQKAASSSGGSSGGGGGSSYTFDKGTSGSTGGTFTGNDTASDTPKYEVNTAYYQGSLNSDAKKYGTFSNGYQPKGISGYGEVTKSGKTIQISTTTLSGQKQTVTQNVWKTSDGTLWYWEGRQNKYIRIGKENNSGSTSGSTGGGGGVFAPMHVYK